MIYNAAAEGTFSTMAFTWGAERLRLPGGLYRLCWCSGALPVHESLSNASELDTTNRSLCATASSFQVDVGYMMIIGVVPFAEDKTCFSGQTCLLDGIQGHQLSVHDLWLPRDTCGVPDQVVLPAAQLVTVSHSGSSIAWGSNAFSLSAGQYRLCWCSGDAPCASHSLTDVGQLHMLGPSPLQSRTCVSGQTCVVKEVVGLGWDMADEFMVMDTCGQNQAGAHPSHATCRINAVDL